MIKLTFETLNDPDFNTAVDQIDNCPSLSVKTLCAFNKFKKTYDAERLTAREVFTKILDKYSIMESVTEGDKLIQKPKMETVGGQVRRAITDPATMDAEVKTLLNEGFDVAINPFSLAELVVCQLTPRQVRSIRPLLVSDEASDNGPKLVKGN